MRRWLSLGRSNTPSTDLEQRPHAKRSRKSSIAGQSPKQLKATSNTGKQISKGESAQAAELTQIFNQAMKQKEAEWQAKEMELEEQLGRIQSQNQRLENGIQQIQGELEHRTRTLEAKVQQVKSEKEKVEAEYSSFLRQKQEEKFKEMDSWLPVEGNKVIGDLNRLKRDMRSFGKGMATDDSFVFQRLDEADHVALLNDLAEVCVLTNGGLPEELTSPRSPALLLNALLAHHVYTSFFKNPFFFLGNGLGDVLPQSGLDSLLNEIYSRTQQGKCFQDSWMLGDGKKTTNPCDTANQEEAHIWRSQTLRLLLPQLRDDATSQEKDLHRWTSELISNVANLQAAHFLEGPARHLIHDGAKINPGSKLQSIYQMAANISYMMWTRRATLKCCTLRHLHQPTFDPESKDLIPHSSVKFDQFEDQLEGRPITLIVHPLLQLYGTNDAKNYDQGSVWAPAEVWLDSRKPTQ